MNSGIYKTLFDLVEERGLICAMRTAEVWNYALEQIIEASFENQDQIKAAYLLHGELNAFINDYMEDYIELLNEEGITYSIDKLKVPKS